MNLKNHGVPSSFKWWQRASLHITKFLPRVLISDTERVGLSLGFIVVGILSLSTLNDDSVFTNLFSRFVVIAWSVMLILGGILTIYGMQVGARLTERAGIMMAGLGCLTYGITLVSNGEGRTLLVGWLFVVLGFIKAIRLIVSTASAAYTAQDDRKG